MKTIQQIEAALAQQAECETALIELAIEMGHEYGRTGTFRPGSPNGLPTPADVRKRFAERSKP